MAFNVDRNDMIQRVRRLANMENSEFASDEDILILINTYIADLYDMLVSAGPPDYYSEDTQLVTIPGQISYELATYIPDFRTLIMVYSQEGLPDFFRPLRQINNTDRLIYRAPQGAFTLKIRYVPTPPQLGTTGLFDSVSGWDEYAVSLAARDLLTKEESNVDWLDMKIARLADRIKRYASTRNKGQGWYVQETDKYVEWPYPYRQTVNAYQLRGRFLDIYSLHPVYP